ncbi:hypothetical protein [Sphingomonas sp.]
MTREQFTKMAADRFAQMDENSDGILSASEIVGGSGGPDYAARIV